MTGYFVYRLEQPKRAYFLFILRYFIRFHDGLGANDARSTFSKP